MRHLRTGCLLSLLLAFLPLLSLAAEQHKSIDLDQKAAIGSSQLKAGHYTLTFDHSQDTTAVEFQQNGKTVATAQGGAHERHWQFVFRVQPLEPPEPARPRVSAE